MKTILIAMLCCSITLHTTAQLPYLKQGQLIVNGKPFLILGGELGNSSASSLEYMRTAWPRIQSLNVNTVLTPVYWELIEPAEGKFDFKLVDSLITQAATYKMKLIFLWFGSWKNSMSCYAPAWVKTNSTRFPRARDRNGKPLEILSAFSDANLQADIKAYSALMKHIRLYDKKQTVITMQVENEIGMLTEAREHTITADSAFTQAVPPALLNYINTNRSSLVPELQQKLTGKTSGTWEDVFGKGVSTDEVFQAWYYAIYANAVTRAGKKEHPLPAFVNAALNRPNAKPGEYPSAGPLPHIMDIWKAAATASNSVDMLSPDFYNPDFDHWCSLYVRQQNVLFIPEHRFETAAAMKAWYAIGEYKALGFSPFSIENGGEAENDALRNSYAWLKQLAPLIFQYPTRGILLDEQVKTKEIKMGDYTLQLNHDYTLGWSPKAKEPGWPASGGIVIQTSTDEFIIGGSGIVITFNNLNEERVGILQAEEGQYVNNVWKPGRRMNGDQDHQGRHIRIPVGDWGIQKVKLYRYK